MPAYVVEASQLPVFASRAEQRLTQQIRGEVIPSMDDLAGMSDDLPRAEENLLSLYTKYLVIGVEASGKRPCALNLGLYAKKIGLDFHGKKATAPQHSTAKRKQKCGQEGLTESELAELLE
jgi:hypothetical protein